MFRSPLRFSTYCRPARHNDIRAAEEDGAVAVGNGVGHVKELNGLIIEEPKQRVFLGNVGRVRNSTGCFEHPALNFFMSENGVG